MENSGSDILAAMVMFLITTILVSIGLSLLGVQIGPENNPEPSKTSCRQNKKAQTAGKCADATDNDDDNFWFWMFMFS